MSTDLTTKPDIPAIVREYAKGRSLRDLAQEHQVCHRTIYLWLLSGIGDQEHEQLVTQCLVNRIADADETLENAQDGLSIARARERMRFSRMDFERRRPHLYGPKQEVRHTGAAPTLNITIAQPNEPKTVIDMDKSMLMPGRE